VLLPLHGDIVYSTGLFSVRFITDPRAVTLDNGGRGHDPVDVCRDMSHQNELWGHHLTTISRPSIEGTPVGINPSASILYS